jgi:chromate transporter
LVPLLEADVVYHYQWLTQWEFVTAVALGQMRPGPLLVTVTLIGHKLSGIVGATAATMPMFLPPFPMAVVLSRHLKRLQTHPLVRRFLWGARASVVGLIVAAGLSLAVSHLTTLGPILLAVVGLGLMLGSEKADPSPVAIGSGLLGVALWSGK